MVLIRPPSMTKFEPLTFAVRGEASSVTRVATSRGVVKRPVGMPRGHLLADRVGVRACSRAYRRRDAVLTEPQVGRDLAG